MTCFRNPQSKKRSFDKCVNSLRSGNSLVVYPEGTRNRNKEVAVFLSFFSFSETVRTQYVTFFEQLLPFKNGAWRFAKEAGVQILPVCIQGGHDAFNHNWIVAPASLVLTYSEPSFVTDENPHEASMARVSEWMTSILKQ